MEARVGVRKLEAIAAHRAMFSFKSQAARRSTVAINWRTFPGQP